MLRFMSLTNSNISEINQATVGGGWRCGQCSKCTRKTTDGAERIGTEKTSIGRVGKYKIKYCGFNFFLILLK